MTKAELVAAWRSSGLSQKKFAATLGIPKHTIANATEWLKKHPEEVLPPKDHYMAISLEHPRVLLRAAVFDLECMNFEAGGIRNHMICGSILPLDSDEVDTTFIHFDEHGDDRRMLSEVCRKLEAFDLLIGHNISAFDFNWLNSRLMYHNMPSLQKRFMVYDTYQGAKRMGVRADRKSLAFLCDYFRVPYIKTAITPVSWSMMDSPNEDEFDEALEDIIYHCEEDVKANRNLFDVLYPRDHALQNMPITKKW